MKTRILIFSILMLLILPELAPVTAQDSVWHVKSIVNLTEVMDSFDASPLHIHLAPDGRHVAYGGEDDSLCILDIRAQQQQCITFDRDLAYTFQVNDFFPALRWSPDSMKIAVVGLPYQYLRDTDLGLVDLSGTEPTFTVLDDDGYVGNLRPGSIDPAANLEINPAFSPDGSQIAVERTKAGTDGKFAQSTLTIFDLTTGEVRDVSKLPGYEEFSVDAGSIISMDWSPDGTTLAVALRHYRVDENYDGVWLVDVATGAWTRIITLADTHANMLPLFGDTPVTLIFAPVRWSPDGSRLLIWADDPGQYVGLQWVFWFDLDSGDLTPIVLPSTESDWPNPRTEWPTQAVWSPDGSQLLIATHLADPPDSRGAMPLVETDQELVTALYLIDVPSGTRTFLGHLPLEAAPGFFAAWGPDGYVMAGGYSFELVRE
jgi:Tol biopolymer transport system component